MDRAQSVPENLLNETSGTVNPTKEMVYASGVERPANSWSDENSEVRCPVVALRLV